MKAFEEWHEENMGGLTDEDLHVVFKKIWRAALEMVKREIFEHREALDVIEEELEGTK